MHDIGRRLLVIDRPSIDVAGMAAEVRRVQAATGATRAIVIVDYLQRWPVLDALAARSDLEHDRWRTGEMLRLRDALGPGDAVIVLSEARRF